MEQPPQDLIFYLRYQWFTGGLDRQERPCRKLLNSLYNLLVWWRLLHNAAKVLAKEALSRMSFAKSKSLKYNVCCWLRGT